MRNSKIQVRKNSFWCYHCYHNGIRVAGYSLRTGKCWGITNYFKYLWDRIEELGYKPGIRYGKHLDTRRKKW